MGEEEDKTEKKHRCQGCGKTTGTELCCPQCVNLGRTTFFCSQTCFAKNWKEHSELHVLIKNQQQIQEKSIPAQSAPRQSHTSSRGSSHPSPRPEASTAAPSGPLPDSGGMSEIPLTTEAEHAGERRDGVWRRNGHGASSKGSRSQPQFAKPAPRTPSSSSVPLAASASGRDLDVPGVATINDALQNRRLMLLVAFVMVLAFVAVRSLKGPSQTYPVVDYDNPHFQKFHTHTNAPQVGGSMIDGVSVALEAKFDRVLRELEGLRSELQRHEEQLEALGETTGLRAQWEAKRDEQAANNVPDEVAVSGDVLAEAKPNPRLMGRKDVDVMFAGPEEVEVP